MEPGLESARIKIVGQSIIGTLYTKEINLTRARTHYILTYSCRAKVGFESLCRCEFMSKGVEKLLIEKFLESIKSLKDEGEKAKCCDHPWTEIELAFANGTTRKLVVPFDLIKVESLFEICKGF